jgi:hypothetical protein
VLLYDSQVSGKFPPLAAEPLTMPDGEEVDSQLISENIQRVARRIGHTPWFHVSVVSPTEQPVRI